MALLRYLQAKDGLPDPKRSLSLSIPSRAIAAAKEKVTMVTTEMTKERVSTIHTNSASRDWPVR